MSALDNTISDQVTINISNQIALGKINWQDTVVLVPTVTGISSATNIKVDIFH